jgi:hypothetical protein
MNFGGPVPIFTVDAANADLIQSDSIVSVGAIAGAVDYTPGNYRVVSSSGTSFFINLDGDFSGVAGGALHCLRIQPMKENPTLL